MPGWSLLLALALSSFGQDTGSEVTALRQGELAPLLEPTAPPPGAVRRPAEYGPVAAVWVVYPGWPEYDGFFLQLARELVAETEVHVLLDRRDRWRAELLLQAGGLEGEVHLHEEPVVESVWIRDYGPEPVVIDGRLAWLDARYCDDCTDDDVAPTRLGRALDIPVYRPDLWLDGGHLVSTGTGTCFATTDLASLNEQPLEWVEAVLGTWYGCERTVFLEPLQGNVVAHVDMFLAVAGEDLVLLGAYEPEQDRVNHAVLEDNLGRLLAARTADGRPLRVIRVPMPDRAPDLLGPRVRSHVNLLPVNGRVLVPVYVDDPPERREQVLARVGEAFPGRLVVAIEADEVARDDGAIHCITRTVPGLDPPTSKTPAPPGPRPQDR